MYIGTIGSPFIRDLRLDFHLEGSIHLAANTSNVTLRLRGAAGAGLATARISDWQRLLGLCALTSTLVIDEDGCYDPADFKDGLLLGLKGVMASAELHFLGARLQGGKLHKAQKGELCFPLSVGFATTRKAVSFRTRTKQCGARYYVSASKLSATAAGSKSSSRGNPNFRSSSYCVPAVEVIQDPAPLKLIISATFCPVADKLQTRAIREHAARRCWTITGKDYLKSNGRVVNLFAGEKRFYVA